MAAHSGGPTGLALGTQSGPRPLAVLGASCLLHPRRAATRPGPSRAGKPVASCLFLPKDVFQTHVPQLLAHILYKDTA